MRPMCSVAAMLQRQLMPIESTLWRYLAVVVMTTLLTMTYSVRTMATNVNFWTSKLDVADEIVCQSKYFRARCAAADEVIVVRRARYGRMNLSRCVKENFGYIGCSNDVLDVLDGHCSGRRSCNLRVLDENFMNMKPCHEDLKSYLAVQYTCVKALSPKRSTCLGDHPIVVSQSSGVLASIVAAETGCGTAEAPWRLQVLQGQRINVTLVDFSWAVVVNGGVVSASGTRVASVTVPSSVTTSDVIAPYPLDCRVYAVVRETPEAIGVTVCGGETRTKTVYVSRSNRVEIQLVNLVSGNTQQISKTNYAFVLVYEAIGCPDIEAPPGGWIQRTDRTLMVGCSRTTETWQLHCNKDLHWVGEMRNCSPAKLETMEADDELIYTTIMFPSGLLVVIVLAMALLVGLFILVVGVICLTRLHGRTGIRRCSSADNSEESKRIVYSPATNLTSMSAIRGSRRSRFGPFHIDRDSRLEDANADSTCVTDIPLVSEYGTARLVQYGTATYGHVRGNVPLTTSGTAATAAATIVISTSPSDDGRATLLLQPSTTTSPRLLHSIHHPHHTMLFQDYGCCADVVSSPSTTSASGNRLAHVAAAAAAGGGGNLSDEGYASRPPSYAVFFSSSQSSNSSSGRPVICSRKKGSTSTGSYDAVNPLCDSGCSGSSSGSGETPAAPEVTSDAIDDSLHGVRSTPIMTSRSRHAHAQSTPLCQTKEEVIYYVQPTTQWNTSEKNSLRSQHYEDSSAGTGRDNHTATTDDGDVNDGGRWRNGDRAMCDLTSSVSGVMVTPQQNDSTSGGVIFEFEYRGDSDKKNVAVAERIGLSSPVRRDNLIDTN